MNNDYLIGTDKHQPVPLIIGHISLFISQHLLIISRAISFFIFHSSLFILTGCADDGRQRAQIPAVPRPGDPTRQLAALTALNRAIRLSGAPSAYAKRAGLLLSTGQVVEARQDIDEAIGRNPNVGSFYLTRAQVLRAARQPALAYADAQRAEILGINAPELFTLMGDVLQQQNQFGPARRYLAKALQVAPFDGEAYFFNGLLTARQGDTTTAVGLYNRSLQLKPRYLETYRQLAAIYRATGQSGTALAYTEQALRYFPKNAPLQYSRGLIYQSAGRLDSAMIAYQAAVRLNPAYVQPVFQAGLIWLKWRAYDRALANFERVAQLQPQFERIGFFIGQCLEQTGQTEPAIAAYTKALARNPADRAAQFGLWRTQRQLYYGNRYPNYLPQLPTSTTATTTTGPTGPQPDTNRIRLAPIQPRARLPVGNDSVTRPIR
jgi:tetratricopeptide (TPR) repeat protein